MKRGANGRQYDSQIFQNYDLVGTPMRASNSESNEMRIKTLPNELIYEEVNDEPDPHTFNFGREKRLNSQKSIDKSINNNEIEYFQLDLKGIVNKNKSQAKSIDKTSNVNSKQALRSILGQFLMKLTTFEEDKIQQTSLNRLTAHFNTIDKQNNKLTELMNFSIKELKGKLQQTSQCSNVKLCESKTQRDFLDHKYNKFYRKNPIECRQTANIYRTPCTQQSTNDYKVKKIVKTMVDEQGNQFRVTVQRIK